MTDEHDELHPGEEASSPEAGFMTDTLEIDTGVAEIPDEPDSATVIAGPDLSHLDTRPSAGEPREYHFPKFERFQLDNGLTVLSSHMPGRALLAANLVMAGGGASEPEDLTMDVSIECLDGTMKNALVNALSGMGYTNV